MQTTEGRIVEAERSANALRQDETWLVLRTNIRPVWLKESVMGRVIGDATGEISRGHI